MTIDEIKSKYGFQNDAKFEDPKTALVYMKAVASNVARILAEKINAVESGKLDARTATNFAKKVQAAALKQ